MGGGGGGGGGGAEWPIKINYSSKVIRFYSIYIKLFKFYFAAIFVGFAPS